MWGSEIREAMRTRLLQRAGVFEHREPIDLLSLKDSEWSPDFERLMRNRLVFGAIRYGKLHAPNKPQYDRVKSCIKRLKMYESTGNKEFLVDVANLCLLEFEECHHPNAHFSTVNEHDYHVNQVK